MKWRTFDRAGSRKVEEVQQKNISGKVVENESSALPAIGNAPIQRDQAILKEFIHGGDGGSSVKSVQGGATHVATAITESNLSKPFKGKRLDFLTTDEFSVPDKNMLMNRKFDYFEEKEHILHPKSKKSDQDNDNSNPKHNIQQATRPLQSKTQRAANKPRNILYKPSQWKEQSEKESSTLKDRIEYAFRQKKGAIALFIRELSTLGSRSCLTEETYLIRPKELKS